MPTQSSEALHLTSEWFIQPGREHDVARVIPQLVADVHAGEPDTLIYFAHKPKPPTSTVQSLPPPVPNSLLFFEVYRDAVFTRFVADHGALSIPANGCPFTFVEFIQLEHGFMRALSHDRISTVPAS